MRAPAASVLVLLVAAPAEARQQGSIQLSSQTQVVQGDSERRGTENAFEPDFGVSLIQPQSRFGELQLEVRGTRRGNELHLGRASFAVRDAKARGISWTFEGGDLYSQPALGDYQFSNLNAASLTLNGAAVTAKTQKTTTQVVGGRTTAWRNIFGTDPDTLGQSLAFARSSYQHNPRLQLNARGARVRTSNLKEFARTIDASEQAGGGTRLVLTPSIHVAADGSFVRYRATGALKPVNDASYLAGAHFLLSRGWLQVNQSHFSPGEFPVLNASLQDRSGLFAAGEYDLLTRVRVFAGWESLDTNIRPSGVSLLRPQASTDRGFGGLRLQVGTQSSVSLRLEDGGRVSRPIRPALPTETTGAPTTSDTGVISAELQSTLGKMTAFARYSRRDNVDSSFSSSTFTQHYTSGQANLNLSRRTQLFGVASVIAQHAASGSASTFLQLTAGGQQQVFREGLFFRIEGTASRNHDLTTDVLTPRNALNVGLNGQIAPRTTIGFNMYLDRAPAGFPAERYAWLARSTFRVVHSIPTGTTRVATRSSIGARTTRGSGSIVGSVFADWNANGQPDPGEGTLEGIPVAVGTLAHVTTARDGAFAFLNVPAGAQHVFLDLNALPVDFDAPAATDLLVEIGRGDTRRVVFGLIPLGSIQGRVIEDSNKNGEIDPEEPPVEGAVLTLDGGMRSVLARKGRFRFDAVRSGDHRVELLKESLPEGSTVVGGNERATPVTREQPQPSVTFLVAIEKRPEVRKVFPPKIGAKAQPAANPPIVAAKASPTPNAPPIAASAHRPVTTAGLYTIQIAALNDALRARAIVEELKTAGFAAYLLEPPSTDPNAPYRIRVGRYPTRVAAEQIAAQLEARTTNKPWITQAR